MSDKSKVEPGSEKAAIELNEDALNEASGGWLAQEPGGVGLEAIVAPLTPKVGKKGGGN